MSVYVVGRIDIRDRARYGEYEAGFMDVFGRFRGRLLAVDESPETVEGTWPCTRTVLIEFPSAADVHAWYDSADYQALAQHRFASASADIAIVNGLPGSATD